MAIDLTPRDVHSSHAAHEILLIDVREPKEFAVERIHGALNYPLSTFDPAFLPTAKGVTLVFQCGTGKRSGMAADKAAAALGGDFQHLAGGITAWKEEGLATVTLDPATGAVVDSGS